jgi:hypothetical protein
VNLFAGWRDQCMGAWVVKIRFQAGAVRACVACARQGGLSGAGTLP